MNLDVHYTCELCSEILTDPVFHQCCTEHYDDEKLYCRDCLENYYELNDASGVEGPLKPTLKPCDCSFKRCVEAGKVVRVGSGPHGGNKSFRQVRALWPLLDRLRTSFRCKRHGCGFECANHAELMRHISTDCAYARIQCPFNGCDVTHYNFYINGEHRRLYHEYVWCNECEDAVANIEWVGHVKKHWTDIRLCMLHALCVAYGESPNEPLKKYLSSVVSSERGSFDAFLTSFVNMTRDKSHNN